MDRRALTVARCWASAPCSGRPRSAAPWTAQGSIPDTAGTAGATASAAAVTPTGETTTISVSMAEMRFTPDRLEVPAGNTLVIELSNDDPHDVHDLVLATGATSGRLQPGESTVLDGGVVAHDMEGCARSSAIARWA